MEGGGMMELNDQRRRRRGGDAAALTHLYFMPVCFPVDSFKEMCRGVKEPKLRAMMATVRNLARAWFTMLGLVAFCLLCSPFPRFRLWSVQAMDTCMAAPGPGRSDARQKLLKFSLKHHQRRRKSVRWRDGGAAPSSCFSTEGELL